MVVLNYSIVKGLVMLPTSFYLWCFLFFLTLSSHVLSLDAVYPGKYFMDFPDDGTREAAFAMEAYQEHYLKSNDYSFNVSIPGFIRKSVSNVRLYNQPDGKHIVTGKYKYKWMGSPQFETGDDLHFLINGKNRSFFTIQIEGGLIGYTRDGRFRVDHRNQLVTLSGNFPVLGKNGRIILPNTGHYTITRSGGFYVDDTYVDTFEITQFKYFSEMSKYLNNTSGTIFILTKEIAIEEDPQYNILQGFLAQSNSFKSHDGWYYRQAHKYTANGLERLIASRRTLFKILQ